MSELPFAADTAAICKKYGVGLTGGIATGKSTIKNFFAEKNIPVFDADTFARQALEIGQDGYKKFCLDFGSGFMDEKGNVNRAKLGAVIFSDAEKRKKLEQIIHPEIRKLLGQELRKIQWSDKKFFIFEASLLIETGLYKYFAEVWCTTCSPEEQLKRLQERNRISLEAAQKIIESQISNAERLIRADIVLDTNELFSLEKILHSRFLD